MFFWAVDKQTDRQTDKLFLLAVDKQTDRQTDRQTDKMFFRAVDKQTDRQTDRQTVLPRSR